MSGKKKKGGTPKKGVNPTSGLTESLAGAAPANLVEVPTKQPLVEESDEEEVPYGFVNKIKNIDGKFLPRKQPDVATAGNKIVVPIGLYSLERTPTKVRITLPDPEVISVQIEEPVATARDVPASSSAKGKISQMSYSDMVKEKSGPVGQGDQKTQVNFRFLEPFDSMDDVDVVLPMDSVRVVQSRFENTLYGYFLGKRQAYPVVENYVKNSWAKYGLQRLMMNSNGFFFFKFGTKQGMQSVLENGPWLIRNTPIFLNIWSPTVLLKKEDIKTVAVWIKVHNVPMAAYTEDGLSMLATKLGTPKLLDSYTCDMCMESWGRSSYARAFVEISAENDFKDVLTMAIPNLEDEGYVKETMKVEYEWKPPRCENCKVFGHATGQCLTTMEPTLKSVVAVDGFQEVKKKKKVNHPKENQKLKLVYRPVTKPYATTSGASNSKVVSRNQYEVLHEDGDMTNELDDFDADIDEHIVIPEETSGRSHGAG